MKINSDKTKQAMEKFIEHLGCDSAFLILTVKDGRNLESIQVGKGFSNAEVLGVLEILKHKLNTDADISEVKEIVKQVENLWKLVTEGRKKDE